MSRKASKELQSLIEFAASLGFIPGRSNGGHIKFIRPGCQPVFTSSTPSDHRAYINARSTLKKSANNCINPIASIA